MNILTTSAIYKDISFSPNEDGMAFAAPDKIFSVDGAPLDAGFGGSSLLLSEVE